MSSAEGRKRSRQMRAIPPRPPRQCAAAAPPRSFAFGVAVVRAPEGGPCGSPDRGSRPACFCNKSTGIILSPAVLAARLAAPPAATAYDAMMAILVLAILVLLSRRGPATI